MTTIDRATCREETRVYTAWCIGATFVLIAAVQCVSWVAHAVR